VARIERPVLIIGERGTGKELAAARLHYLSQRWQGPLVTLNCAALTSSLLDAELFGHEVGAFTGATVRRKGRFENADTGTLFLDEIANLSPQAQEKILRVVEYGSFDRVGGSRSVTVNVRIVGATNVDLPERAKAGAFKEDLLDRLSFEVLTVPPLRMREGDVQMLTRHFAARMAISMGFETPEFSARAMAMLTAHDWPGNVRELKNVVERAVYRTGPGIIREVTFDPFSSPYRPAVQAKPDLMAPREKEIRARCAKPELDIPLARAVRDLEEGYLAAALEQSRHNQKQAAALLGLTYHQFRGLYRRLRGGRDD